LVRDEILGIGHLGRQPLSRLFSANQDPFYNCCTGTLVLRFPPFLTATELHPAVGFSSESILSFLFMPISTLAFYLLLGQV